MKGFKKRYVVLILISGAVEVPNVPKCRGMFTIPLRWTVICLPSFMFMVCTLPSVALTLMLSFEYVL